MLDLLIYYLKFGGGRFFNVFFFVLILYCMARFLYCIFSYFLIKEEFENPFKFFKTIFFVCLIAFVFFLLTGMVLNQTSVYNAVPSKLSFFSNTFIHIDELIFGRYLPFWFQDINNPAKSLFDFFSLLIVNTYFALAAFLSFGVLLLLAVNSNLFSKAIFAFALTLIISIPLWFFFPAVTPLDAYYNNIIKIEPPSKVQAALINYRPNSESKKVFEYLNELEQKTNNFFAITTMPSMHIAWSVLMVYFGIKMWRWLAVFLVPYFIINAVATLYLLMHYTIDLPAGLAVAVISIWLAEAIIKNKTPKLIQDLNKYIVYDTKLFISVFSPVYEFFLSKKQ